MATFLSNHGDIPMVSKTADPFCQNTGLCTRQNSIQVKVDQTMDWVNEGRKAAHQSPDHWEEVRDAIYRELSAKREKNVKQLEYDGRLLKQQEQDTITELNAVGSRPLIALYASFFEWILYLSIALGLFWASYESISSGLSLMPQAQGAYFLAVFLSLGLPVAFGFFLHGLSRILPETTVHHCRIYIIFFGLLCYFGGQFIMNLQRSESMAVRQMLDATQPAAVIEGSLIEGAQSVADSAIMSLQRRSVRLSSLLLFLTQMGMEITAGFVLHEVLNRLPVILILLTHQKLRSIRRRIVARASQIEKWKQAPEIARDQFIRGTLMGERQTTQDLPRQNYHLPQGAGLIIGLVGIALLFFLLMFFLVKESSASEILPNPTIKQVVLTAVDLTGSSDGTQLFENLRAVPQIVSGLKPASRFVVSPITNQSFSEPVIIDARLTGEPGQFGERLKSGKREIIRVWNEKKKQLKARSKETDIFGAVARASLIFEETPGAEPILIVLSDMRQAKGNYNFEKHPKINSKLAEEAVNDGLVPSLKSVRVWVLGAHAEGVSQIYWMRLRDFWREYFRRAGAELVIYTPNRRWNHE